MKRKTETPRMPPVRHVFYDTITLPAQVPADWTERAFTREPSNSFHFHSYTNCNILQANYLTLRGQLFTLERFAINAVTALPLAYLSAIYMAFFVGERYYEDGLLVDWLDQDGYALKSPRVIDPLVNCRVDFYNISKKVITIGFEYKLRIKLTGLLERSIS